MEEPLQDEPAEEPADLAVTSVEPVEEKGVDPLRVIEAALFIANKKLTVPEVALVAKVTVKRAGELVEQLKQELSERNSSIQLIVENGQVSLEVKPEFLAPVAGLSKETGLSRKSTRILGLVAKKGGLLQSELKNFFRGEIYAYVTELKEAGYLTAEKKGNTRMLKPTKKFEDSFQLSA